MVLKKLKESVTTYRQEVCADSNEERLQEGALASPQSLDSKC